MGIPAACTTCGQAAGGGLQRLTDEVCFEAMWRGIRTVKPGTRLGDIGHAIPGITWNP